LRHDNLATNQIIEICASTAPIVGSYLLDTVKKWWNQRVTNQSFKNNEATINNLLKEIEDLKSKIDNKNRTEITTEEVNSMKEKAIKVENLGETLNEKVFSSKEMNNWANTIDLDEKTLEKDAEGLGDFYMNILRIAIDNWQANGMKRNKKEILQMLRSSLDVNLDEYLRVKEIYSVQPSKKVDYLDSKYLLKNTFEKVREELRTA
jgi:hypothetical protein